MFVLNKIIKKLKLLYINIVLGGIFGLSRGIILVFFIFFGISKYSDAIYLNLINKSFLIDLFFE
ncbi:hypothetical protein D9V62_00860 [Buchnera aphidicola (Aphis helianthi)]|uniref:Uncharacterized protein n=1 Tax=Buchnera aphidicola (Aphis helianthi) TaxID=2315802 RepID=A0A4D6XR23_9GAMM|nr:hypothetical protein [Buchnera aphidicola]QCI17000.1 hypothetical protein D9V62_00860 [Buchnera aphidicola (Aphis helianthi)]